jgi:hypothetical protein
MSLYKHFELYFSDLMYQKEVKRDTDIEMLANREEL